MKHSIKRRWTKFLISGFFCLFIIHSSEAQFGIGLTASNDFYNIYNNPEDGIAHRRNGSVLLNIALGPKIWVGGKTFSVSVESQANLSLLGLAIRDYKGLGAVSFPIMGKLNFGGLSGLNKVMKAGFSVGGGVQYNRTEIFGLTQEFVDRGVTRDFFRTYNIQIGGGVGISGFTAELFGRYGFNPDLDSANNFHIGLQFGFNIIQLKKIKRPESEL